MPFNSCSTTKAAPGNLYVVGQNKHGSQLREKQVKIALVPLEKPSKWLKWKGSKKGSLWHIKIEVQHITEIVAFFDHALS